jgi:hypothetical protein
MREAPFAFVVLPNPLDGPACESDVQPGFASIVARVPDQEPFCLFRLQGVMRPKEMVAAAPWSAALEPERTAPRGRSEAVGELVQEIGQGRAECQNLIDRPL